MVEQGYEVVWTRRSEQQMRQAFKHISKDSPKNASKVIQDIADAVQKAIPNPEIYNPDKCKVDNDGSYRAPPNPLSNSSPGSSSQLSAPGS